MTTDGNKKIFSCLIAFMLIFSLFPVASFADDSTVTPMGVSTASTPITATVSKTVAQWFPDSVMAYFVAEAMTRSSGGSTPVAVTDIVTDLELSQITNFSIWGGNGVVQDFSGIEYLTGITNIDIDAQAVSKHLPLGTLQNMPNLSDFTMMFAFNVSYGDFPVGFFDNCSNLKYITLVQLDLTTLKINNLPSLESLNCAYSDAPTSLTALEITNCPNLTTLDCSMNALSTLDLSGSPNLTNLNCSNNKIATLNLSATSMDNLNVAYNPITNLNQLKAINSKSFTYTEDYVNYNVFKDGGKTLIIKSVGDNYATAELPQWGENCDYTTAIHGTSNFIRYEDIIGLYVTQIGPYIHYIDSLNNTMSVTIVFGGTNKGPSAISSSNPTGNYLTIQPGAGGIITLGAQGNYKAGERISIGAAAIQGYHFSHWSTSNGGTFDNSTSASTVFTMPNNATIIVANFASVTSGGTSSGSSGGSSGGLSSRGSGKVDSSTSNRPKTTTPKDITKDEAISTTKKAGSSGFVRFVNSGNISLEALKAIVSNASNKNIIVRSDSAENNAVNVRIEFEASKATKGINLYASSISSNAVKIKTHFKKYFKNNFIVVELKQKDSFGIPVNIAVKIDKDLANSNLVFYSYDVTTNQYKLLKNQNYYIDKNGYVHFTTEIGGYIIITNDNLAK